MSWEYFEEYFNEHFFRDKEELMSYLKNNFFCYFLSDKRDDYRNISVEFYTLLDVLSLLDFSSFEWGVFHIYNYDVDFSSGLMREDEKVAGVKLKAWRSNYSYDFLNKGFFFSKNFLLFNKCMKIFCEKFEKLNHFYILAFHNILNFDFIFKSDDIFSDSKKLSLVFYGYNKVKDFGLVIPSVVFWYLMEKKDCERDNFLLLEENEIKRCIALMKGLYSLEELLSSPLNILEKRLNEISFLYKFLL